MSEQVKQQGIPGWLRTIAAEASAAILVPDYRLARRQRCHMVFAADGSEIYAGMEIAECLAALHERDYQTVILLPGRHSRPEPIYWITLSAVQKPWENT